MLLGAGCGSSSASGGGTTTPVKASNDTAAKSTRVDEKKDPPPPAQAEEDVLVKVKPEMFPPVDAGGWTCEPKNWDGKGVALMHCTAPAGTTGLIAALKEMPDVVSAEPAK